MNDNEAKQFIRDLINAFPSFETAAKESYDLAATHRSWAKAWDDLTLDECQRVLDTLIKTGEIDWADYRAPGPFIRRLVMKLRGTTSEQDRHLEDNRLERMGRPRDYSGSPMAEALARAIKMRREGSSEAEIRSMLEAAFPDPPAYAQRSYGCHACWDRGMVDVWRADVVRLLQVGRMNYEQLHSRHTYPIACSCSKGHHRNEVKKPLPVYNPDKWCLFRDEQWEDELNRLREFIKRKPSNYEPAFDYVG